ncbi:MAG TPA: tetratricopeptide repeat protein, partial [Alphaproteobacteria bacterium]|nr:tetratricopeptide repeat protein [Alphaproteobacteria bacterium]
LAPDDIRCWSGLGSLLRAVRRPAEAALAAGRAAALRPGLAEAHANHGDALREAGALAEAEAALRRAVALGPGRAELLAGLGAVLKAADRPEAAAAVFAAAVALAPDHPRIQGNLAQARHAANRLDAAAAAHRRALLLAPGDPDLRFAAAQTALARGEIAAGFDLHEGGFAAGLRPVRHAGLPAWDGSPLAGRTILVWREQGVGDELHFASCYADLIAAAGHVVIEAEPRLVPLMRRSFPAATVVPEDGAPPEVLARVELQVAAGSLPRFLRRRPEDFPRRAGHLVPDPAAVAARRAELAALGPGPKVGIAWRSARGRHAVAAEVSRIADWEPLLRRPGLRFVGLQYDDSAEERAFALERFGAPIHVVPGLDLRGDLDGGAALTAALDLVVSVPISAADMATAVGTPLWLVARLPHPRLLGQAEYPWGRNVRPFGRRPDEPWSAVLARVAAALPGG